MKKENFEDMFEDMVDIDLDAIDENSPGEPFVRSEMSEEEYQALVAFCKRNGYKLNII